jgi:hypothetical protein
MDQDIRRSGRVSRKDVEEVFYDVKEMGGATSTQVLMMIRCCGSLVPDEPPPVRTQLVQEIWGSLEGMGECFCLTIFCLVYHPHQKQMQISVDLASYTFASINFSKESRCHKSLLLCNS